MNPELPAHLLAVLDQAQAAARDCRADAVAARSERRCVAPPMGCGQPLPSSLATAFRDRPSRAEYEITGLCQSCQDLHFAPSSDEIAEMAADTRNYGRCGDCGHYRPYEFVDIGIGVIHGFDCCSLDVRLPRCNKTEGCWLSADHAFACDVGQGGEGRDRRAAG